MKSKIAERIEKETPKELSDKVRTDTNLFLSGVVCSFSKWYNAKADFRPSNKIAFWTGIVMLIAIAVKILSELEKISTNIY